MNHIDNKEAEKEKTAKEVFIENITSEPDDINETTNISKFIYYGERIVKNNKWANFAHSLGVKLISDEEIAENAYNHYYNSLYKIFELLNFDIKYDNFGIMLVNEEKNTEIDSEIFFEEMDKILDEKSETERKNMFTRLYLFLSSAPVRKIREK